MQADTIRSLIDAGVTILIWLVQIVIYPSFRFADVGKFQEWHLRYTSRIFYFVMPLMGSQLALTLWQCGTMARTADFVSLALLAVAWLVTFFVSVPCHEKLHKEGHNAVTIDRLIKTNWLRTAAWTAALIAGLSVQLAT